ncbi:FAD-binding protein [Stieleria sp. TO1_6]|uniref:FAD-binding protein n=1 Tax=Stieleria tagensis TaxID=2956795 RepID=UPI00209B0E3A|nr:FAD-binding protein [Stieleria tagensis]MCO8124866.1 FAD-binding protein [Stieleria tagensis]
MSEIESNPSAANAANPVCPDSIDQVRQLILDSESVLMVGNRSKPTLSAVTAETTLVSSRSLSGIVEYEPSEFTFTAMAGTTLNEINDTLRDKRQYMPFDPLLADHNATIGGTLAAGISGPGRHRYGGVRDFVLGAQFVAGDGQLIQSGGKVVKNAAGFDIPKLLVGSCGRFGAITQLTFKVFPRPQGIQTYQVRCSDHAMAATVIAAAARGRWELDAIDYSAKTRMVWLRISGAAEISQAIADDMQRVGVADSLTRVDSDQAALIWQQLGSFEFGPELDCVAKVPTTLRQMIGLADWCDTSKHAAVLHNSVAGAISWIALSQHDLDDFDTYLRETEVTGQLMRGPRAPDGRLVIGNRGINHIESAIKHAMDPVGRFPIFER